MPAAPKDAVLTKEEAAAKLGMPLREIRKVEADTNEGQGGTVVTVIRGTQHLIRPDGTMALVNRRVAGYPTLLPDEPDDEDEDADTAVPPSAVKKTSSGGR